MITHDQKHAIEDSLKENEVMGSNQRAAVRRAIGDSHTLPKMTADPRVNCQVDVIVCKSPPWQNLWPFSCQTVAGSFDSCAHYRRHYETFPASLVGDIGGYLLHHQFIFTNLIPDGVSVIHHIPFGELVGYK